MNNLWFDIRYALRQLRKEPGFTLTAVATLALGIGALTTVATWTNAVLYNPWPHVANPETVRFIDATVLGGEGYSVHIDQVRFIRDSNRSFSNVMAFMLAPLNLMQPGAEAQALNAGLVSSNYFQFLGLKPEAGHFFDASASDRAYGSHDEIVLSDHLWRDRFATDPSVVGRAVSINQHIFTVIGVAPRDFSGVFGGIAELAWVPLSSVRELSADAEPDPLRTWGLQAAVRLRPGVHDAAAAAELHTLARTFALTQRNNARYNGWDLNLRDAAHFERGFFGVIGEQLPVLLGASVLLMILVCVNIASLLAQRGARQRCEIAIRTALGARPTRIASQVFIETAMLAFAGTVAGYGASTFLSRTVYVLLPDIGLPLTFNLSGDARIFHFVAAVAIVTTLACGMYPVRQSLRISQREALHEGGAAVTGARSRVGQRVLLGFQLGVCFVVLVCCGLLTRTAINIVTRSTGFNRANVLTASLDLSRSSYTEERGLAFQAALLDKLRSMPGVAGATMTSHLPMGDDGSGDTQAFSIPGYVPAKNEEMDVVTDFEGPEFFHTMGIPLLEGREFTSNDNTSSATVAVINETMARRYWPKGDAVGHSIVVNGKKSWQIVGIVHDYAYTDPENMDPSPLLFLPMAQYYVGSDVKVAVRSRSTASTLAPELRSAVASLDSSLPVEDVRTLEQVAGERYQFASIPAELLAVYALSSLLVAMLGLYAVTAYSVIERNREFALRMALGSTRSGIFRLVLQGGAITAAFGLLAGGLGSIAAVRLIRSMLFQVAPFDPVSYCAAALFLLLTVVFSGLAPARRAARIEPMRALRSE
jgi:macrolide transport system ATP-binding/permease protein